MSVIIHEANFTVYKKIFRQFINEAPLWINPLFVEIYNDKKILIALRGNNIVGIWIIPLVKEKNTIIAKRLYRFFPYSSPFLIEEDNLKRRETLNHFLGHITSRIDSIYLPLSPYFYDIAEFSSYGAFVEMRHTHILKNPIKLQKINNRLRNHINYALKNITIEIDHDPKKFNFKLAIRGHSTEQKLRSNLAVNMIKNKTAVIFSAKKGNKSCAGILLMYDKKTAHMLHSWQSKNAPRGVISALIYKAIDWTFKNNLQNFDFEGSVINNIDYFFSGFNAQIIPYGFVHWAKIKEQLYDLINISLKIEGRIQKDEEY